MMAVGPPVGLYTHLPAAYTSGSGVLTESAMRNMLVATKNFVLEAWIDAR
jgi:hypothetical protein